MKNKFNNKSSSKFKSSTFNNNPHKKRKIQSLDDLLDIDQQNFDKIEMQQPNDSQYSKLLKQTQSSKISNQKVKPNNYFQNNAKYSGINQQQISQSKQEQSLSESYQNQNMGNIKNLLKNENSHSNSKLKSKLLQDQIRVIQQEDQQVFEQIKKQDVDVQAGKSLKNQLSCFSKLVQYRYFGEGGFQQIKKYPVSKQNLPFNENLHQRQKQAQRGILNNIKILMKASQQLFMKSNMYKKKQSKKDNNKQIQQSQNQLQPQQQIDEPYNKTIQEIETILDQSEKDQFQSCKINSQYLFQSYLQSSKQIRSSIQKELIKWSQKTTLNNMSSANSQYSYLIMQTPIGQANKVIQNFDRAAQKSQQKRGTFKILFQPEQNVRIPNCKEIFDDQDLFHQLQKQFEKQLNKDDDPQLLINDTMKYLKERQNRVKVQKDVDRKASKNRKLRFNVHPKLLNFMSCQNSNLLQARDEIVKNIFNHGKNQNQQIDYIDM